MPRCMSDRARRFMKQHSDIMAAAADELMRKTMQSPTLTLEPGEKILGGLLVVVDNAFVHNRQPNKRRKRSR